MKLTLVLLAACIALSAATAPLLNADTERVVPDQYMVVFHKNSTSEIRDLHVAELKTKFEGHERILHTFSIGTLIGFSAVLSKATLAKQLTHPNVRYVEADQHVSINDNTIVQPGATWGIDRISQRTLPLDSSYPYFESSGFGVFAYVIDTGVLVTHNDIRGRAEFGFSSIAGEANTDLNGHGTHVAGTIGGTTWGVAKKVTIIAVKVLNGAGSGTFEGVVAGVNYVTAHHKANSKTTSVANMSLGGGATPTLDEAVEQSSLAGCVHVVAAGNSAANACNYSPARAPSAITVGATTNTDARASFSNTGPCVDTFAPGNLITSSWIGSDTATNTISGTSMASPHVAGIVAVRIGNVVADRKSDDISVSGIDAWVKTVASQDVVTNPGTGSPNDLAYSPYSDIGIL
jgi:subtilisin family serine protease